MSCQDRYPVYHCIAIIIFLIFINHIMDQYMKTRFLCMTEYNQLSDVENVVSELYKQFMFGDTSWGAKSKY